MPTSADLWAGLGLSAAFVLLIVIAEVWRRLRSPPTEYTRKLVHMGGGLVALAIPFLIHSHWVVLAMAAGMGAVFLLSRQWGMLPSLHAVERRTRGVEYYPLAVYGLFLLTEGQIWKYVICLLVLAVADALAALVGKRFGRLRYQVDEDYKSLEGSLVFFGVTFAVIAIPLLTWPDADIPPPTNCLLVAVLAAALATGFEAISLDGRDNLWLPLGLCIVLTKLLRQPQYELVVQNFGFLAITLAIVVAASLSRAMNVGATLVFVLATYAAWSLASSDWALPPAIGLALYLAARLVGRAGNKLRSRRITRLLLLPFGALALANAAWLLGWREWYAWLYGPYLIGCVAVVILGMGSNLAPSGRAEFRCGRVGVVAVATLAAVAMVIPIFLLQDGASALSATTAVLMGIAIGLAFASYAREPAFARSSKMSAEWLVAAAMVALAATQALGISPAWNAR